MGKAGSKLNELDWLGSDVEESFFRELAPPSSSLGSSRVVVGEVVGGRFAIERLVGGGGMGAVFRATDHGDGQIVAVKVLEKLVYADRFEREANILSSLRHPGIVRYIAHGGTAGSAAYLVMEWLEGEELSHRMMRSRLSMTEGLRVVLRASEALAEEDVDARADVFALGCVLFECLTGAPAFSGTHPLAVLAEEPPRVGTAAPELALLEPLLSRVLAKERNLRPRDAGKLHEELLDLEQRVLHRDS